MRPPLLLVIAKELKSYPDFADVRLRQSDKKYKIICMIQGNGAIGVSSVSF